MSAGDGALLDALYDPANGALLKHEKDRAQFFKRGIAAVWGGATILDYASAPELLDLQVVGATATARLYDRVAVRWVPPTRAAPAALQRLRQSDPDRYREAPTGAQGEITSRFATRHELGLIKGTQGWRLAKDSYDEWYQFGQSPDLIKGSWSEEPRGGGPRGIPAPPPPTPQVTAMAYSYNLAIQCASSNYAAYNNQYCNYNACGGDCGNFVSQCLRAGGHAPYGNWYTFSGGCGTCGTSATYAGTDTWANNQYLRDYLNTSGRAEPRPDQWNVGLGDIINYDWTATAGGETDHIALINSTLGSTGPSCRAITRTCITIGGTLVASTTLPSPIFSARTVGGRGAR